MYFKRINLHGFKSFADPVSIEFDKGITCVVGPNGSGKSNISDALRWVLGEQSPKMLRGGKMDEVIFAGTASRKSRGMAEVTLVIDNADGSLPIDFSEVSITRRMYRSGDSEYYINNTQCRLRDIRELIMDTGIGVDGYSLIGQGKISEIISGKPESRREIFEEAAGIVKYRSKKAETERKLANTNHNLERVNDIISELEGRIEPLRIESEKAVKYQELSGRFKENEINVTLKNIENTENKATELIVDLAASDKAIAEKENKRQIYERDLGIKKQRLEEIDKEDLAERDGIMQFNLELNELHNKVKLDKEKINSLASSVKLYGEEIQMLSEKLRREENNRAELDKRMATLSEKSSKVEADLKEITEQLAEAESEFAQKSDRFNEERDMIYDLTLQSSTKGAEISSLQQMGVSLRQRFQALHDLPATEEESAAKDALEKGLEQKELLIKEKMEADNKSQKFRQLLDELSAQEESLASKLEKSKISLSEEQTRKNMLQQLEDSYEGYNYAVRFIMKESGIGGIFGTAGELIRVPRGYETAIETALGARMQNIVCKDEICAEKAIKELKKRKIGRLTFLPVDSLRVQPEKSVSEIQGEEGYMGLASDCVDFDAKYRKAIAYLLGGIVIVKDLDNAVRISKKAPGFRYVTLEGEFINPAGAITGGTHKNSGAGIFDRKNRLSECDSRIAELTAEVKNSEFELKKASDGRNDAEKNLVAADADARKVEIDILNLENQLNGYRISMAKHEENMDRHRREVDRVQFEINENENAVVAVIKEKADIDAEIEKLKIGAEALLSESENSRQIITDLQIKQTAVRIDSSKLSSEILNVKGLIDLVVGRIAEIKNDVESKSAAEMSAISQQKSLKENIKEIQEDIVEKEKIQEKQTEKLAKLRDEKNLVSSEINKLSVSKDEIDKELFAEKTLRHELSGKLEK